MTDLVDIEELQTLGLTDEEITMILFDQEKELEENSEDSSYHNEEMKLRGFDKLSPEAQEKMNKSLNWMSNRLGVDLTLNENPDEIKKYIRNKQEVEQFDIIEKMEQKIEEIENKVHDYPKNLYFNPEFESAKYGHNHIIYDIETGKESNIVSIGFFNYEASRLTLVVRSDKLFFQEARQKNGLIIQYLETPFVYEGFLLNDIETTIAATLMSALQEGHKDLIPIYENIKISYVQTHILQQILNHQTRSMYIAHNTTKFDLQHINNEWVDNKHQFSGLFQNILIPETIQITDIFTEQGYKLRLGNSSIGFRFNISNRKRNILTPNIKIAPLQREAYPLNYNCDSLTVARAIQKTDKMVLISKHCFCKNKRNKQHKNGKHLITFQSSSLKVLSKYSDFAKKDFETSTRAFVKEDFVNIITEEMTEETEYLYYDLFSNLDVYADLTNFISFADFEKILDTEIKTGLIPLSQTIFSSATIAKHLIFPKLISDARKQGIYLDKRKIEKNIKSQRTLQQNFIDTYLGGLVEAISHGLIKSTKDLLLWYFDFASLYPHASWIIEVWWLMLESAKGTLLDHVKNDIPEGLTLIKSKVKSISQKIINEGQFSKDDLKMLGNIRYKSEIPLLYRIKKHKIGKKGQKLKAQEISDKYCNGTVKATIPEFMGAIVDYHLSTGISLTKIFNKINIQEIEYVDFKVNTDYGKEFFSKLYLKRDEVKKEMERYNEWKDKEWSQLNSTQMLIKLIINSAYGVNSEGISVEDHTGVLFTPLIANGITATSKMVIRLTHTIIDYHRKKEQEINKKPEKHYSDTDSVIFTGTKEFSELLNFMFKKTIELKDEFPKKKIEQIYIAGKKKYGIIFEDDSIYMKTSGKVNYPLEGFHTSLDFMYRKIFYEDELNISKFASEGKKYFPIQQNVKLNKVRGKYRGLAKFNKQNILDRFEYQGLKFKLIHHEENNNFLITNVAKVQIGQFGDYYNIAGSKNKLMIWLSAPYDKDFDKFVKFLLHRYYNETNKNVMKTTESKTLKTLEKNFEKLHEAVFERSAKETYLRNYFSFNSEQIKREKVELVNDEKGKYWRTKAIDLRKNDLPLHKFYHKLNRPTSIDGLSYTVSMPLLNYQFSNHLLANISKYYSRNIENLTVVASKILHYTHEKEKPDCMTMKDGIVDHDANCYDVSCKVNAYYRTNKKQLPVPKSNTSVMIPLSFKIIPNIKKDKIEKRDILTLDIDIRKKLIKNKVLRELDTCYEIINRKRYDEWITKYRQHEWITMDLFYRKFSISIEKYSSFDYSGIFAISILPEKTDYTKKRIMKAVFRLNPTSHQMLNLELFETTINEVIKTKDNLSKIVSTLLKDNDMQIFERNHAVTKSHALEKQHLVNAMTYQAFLKGKMVTMSKFTTVSLTELTESIQRPIEDKELKYLFPLLKEAILQKSKTLRPKEAKGYLESKENFAVFPHRSSIGITANDFSNGVAYTQYVKDEDSYHNKLLRMSRKRKVPERIMKKLLKKKISRILRFEVAQFGFKKILEFDAHEKLRQLSEFVKNGLEKAKGILPQLESIFTEIKKIIPDFLVIPSVSVFDTPITLDGVPSPPY